MNLITALTATGLAAGLAFTGITSAQAASTSVTLPPGGVLEHRVSKFCARVPDLLEWTDQAQARISGDATTKGSLEWLKAKQAKAESNNHKRVASRIETGHASASMSPIERPVSEVPKSPVSRPFM
jgi:hypothetical protein